MAVVGTAIPRAPRAEAPPGASARDGSDVDTFPKLLLHNAAHWPDAVAMREKELGIWQAYTWRQVAEAVRGLALGLKSLGLGRGEAVALLGRNRPNWVWSELAAHCCGAMTVGIYADALAEEASYLLAHSGAVVAFAEDEEQVDKLLEVGERAPALRWIIFHDPRGMTRHDHPKLVSWEELLRRGAALDAERPDLFQAEVAAGRGEDVGILCTTSGTTSNPKLAMLPFARFLDHVRAYLRADPRGPEDEYVCLLPLPWIMEQVYVLAMPLLCRIRVSFPESQATLMADLREIGPTHLLLAPRVWEQTAADIRARMMDANAFSRWCFERGVAAALAALDSGRRAWLADWLVMSALRDRLGFARVRSAATGGAALGPDTFKFFLAMGVPLRQLYGQTELSGAYTLQDGREVDTDSSGRPFDNTEIRIVDPDADGVGEIVTWHTGMFTGYFKNEAATREVLTEDGWMRTGDAGYLDGKGRLVVIDRVKDIATTAAGVRFSPQYIENKLKFSPYIGECVVFGQGRPWLAAILCIRFSMVAKWAEARRVGFTTYQNLAANPDVQALLAGEVEKVNASLPEGQRLARFLVLYKELDADDGELTRTRKVRRGVIDERYARLIEAIYAGERTVHVATEVTFEDGRKGRMNADIVLHDTAAGRALVRRAA